MGEDTGKIGCSNASLTSSSKSLNAFKRLHKPAEASDENQASRFIVNAITLNHDKKYSDTFQISIQSLSEQEPIRSVFPVKQERREKNLAGESDVV